MDEHEKKMEQWLEKAAARTIQGNYALWNALLTMDSIIITVFTAGLLYLDRSVQLLLTPSILLAVASAGLLIANFRSSRDDFKYQVYSPWDVHHSSQKKSVVKIPRAHAAGITFVFGENVLWKSSRLSKAFSLLSS
jgi:hypothetical protein